jgi:bifunctional ADP-heptose synthase (sugar kinase/adenylyltransferase)
LIVAPPDLDALTGKVTMVSGHFDPLHPGHLEYFVEAAAIGLPLLCNVSCDEDLARKHAPLLTQAERGALIDALAVVTYVHLASGTTEQAIRALRPRYFAKGADWRGRLPPEEIAMCQELGTEIVCLETVTNSSSDILRRFMKAQGGLDIERLRQQR